MSAFTYSEQKGDLFTDKTSSLAHTCSQDMHLRKGIGLLFRRRFGRIDSLLRQGARVGDIAFLKDGRRYIFYLVSKRFFFEKPSYAAVYDCFLTLRKFVREYKIRSLALPQVACGLDGLSWPIVSQMLQDVFAQEAVAVTVFVL